MQAKRITAAILAAVLGGGAAAAKSDGCADIGRARGTQAQAPAPAASHNDAYVVYPEASPEIYPAPAYVVYPEASHVAFADGELLRFDDLAAALVLADQAIATCAEGPSRVASLRRGRRGYTAIQTDPELKLAGYL